MNKFEKIYLNIIKEAKEAKDADVATNGDPDIPPGFEKKGTDSYVKKFEDFDNNIFVDIILYKDGSNWRSRFVIIDFDYGTGHEDRYVLAATRATDKKTALDSLYSYVKKLTTVFSNLVND